jgi:hypothetical protein
MARSVTRDQAALVRCLLMDGATQTEAARRAGISPGTAHRIARGTWRPRGPEEDLFPYSRRRRQARRCPGCGARVCVWPCLYCRLKDGPLAAPPQPAGTNGSPVASCAANAPGRPAEGRFSSSQRGRSRGMGRAAVNNPRRRRRRGE